VPAEGDGAKGVLFSYELMGYYSPAGG